MFIGLGLGLRALGNQPVTLADLWAEKATANGGTYSAGTLAALQTLSSDLASYNLTAKLVYLNPRCGSNLIAARTPLINLASENIDGTSGTFASWNEANGLVNSSSGVMNTNVPANFASFGHYDVSAGAYLLNDAASSAFYTDNDFPATLQFFPRGADSYHIFDFYGTSGLRVQTAVGNIGDGNLTKGLVCGSFYNSSLAFVARNGVIRGTTVGSNGGLEASSRTIQLRAASATSGGDFIGKGITPDDATNLTFVMHAFNTALGRQVTADGLP